MTRVVRDYRAVLERHGLDPRRPLTSAPDGPHAAMRRAIDILWGALGSTGLSWIGFYEKIAGTDEMVLICREPKPACSPIGLQGMCGRGWGEARPIIIADVRTLGANYIACDPKDQSELVVPVIAEGGCWGVLDADSYDLDAFDEHDAEGMTDMLVALGISRPGEANRRTMRL
ncbi:L-methionine (R)-S-oxide reductase [Phycisphaerales bacterium]|nr:L-methionine (R)-S-oxide reductase [Phycisphaerales bacterium]